MSTLDLSMRHACYSRLHVKVAFHEQHSNSAGSLAVSADLVERTNYQQQMGPLIGDNTSFPHTAMHYQIACPAFKAHHMSSITSIRQHESVSDVV